MPLAAASETSFVCLLLRACGLLDAAAQTCHELHLSDGMATHGLHLSIY